MIFIDAQVSCFYYFSFAQTFAYAFDHKREIRTIKIGVQEVPYLNRIAAIMIPYFVQTQSWPVFHRTIIQYAFIVSFSEIRNPSYV